MVKKIRLNEGAVSMDNSGFISSLIKSVDINLYPGKLESLVKEAVREHLEERDFFYNETRDKIVVDSDIVEEGACYFCTTEENCKCILTLYYGGNVYDFEVRIDYTRGGTINMFARAPGDDSSYYVLSQNKLFKLISEFIDDWI